MAHTITVEFTITTEQKAADAQSEVRLDLIRDEVSDSFDRIVGDTIDGIGADGESEYEIAEANIVQVLDRDGADSETNIATVAVEVEVIINRVSGKFAARYELEEAVEECATDILSELVGRGDDDAFIITEAVMEAVR